MTIKHLGGIFGRNPTFNDVTVDNGIYLGGESSGNFLDDYEEGTWTPRISVATGAFSTLEYSLQNGTYTKIGDTVRLHCALATSDVAIGTASGAIKIAGVPFPFTSVSNGPQSGAISVAVRFNTAMTNLRAYANNGEYAIAFNHNATNAGFTLLEATDIKLGASGFNNYICLLMVFKTSA